MFFSCSGKRQALGADNEIRVICSEIDQKIIEKYLSKIFTDTIFTPEPEPYYHLKFSSPETFLSLKSQSQVIVAAIHQDKSNPGYQLMNRLLSSKQISNTLEKDPIILGQDIYANNQVLVIINAKSEELLMQSVENKKTLIKKKFHNLFIDRQSNIILSKYRNTSLEDSLSSKFPWSMNIPWGWELVKAEKDLDYVWIGAEMPFQWISISWYDGNLVDDELKIGNYIWNYPEKSYGFIQFNKYKFELKKTNYNGSVAWRAKGIWETIDKAEAKGGPFQSYLFYDSKNDRTYHLNYLIHYPGKNKSIYMRQMDIIVKTFELKSIW